MSQDRNLFGELEVMSDLAIESLAFSYETW